MSTLALERDPATLSPIELWLADLPSEDRHEAIEQFMHASTALQRDEFTFGWNAIWARPGQRMPEGVWQLWMVRAGRGYGKTRCGSECVRELVREGHASRVTIIAPTASDARDVMIEGPESGLLAVHPQAVRPLYEPSKRLVTWANGAIAHIRSAEEPDGIRGLNSDLVWGDEPASWKSGRLSWDNAMLGNRVGKHPHAVLTGTPRPLPWLRELESMPGTVLATGSTYENIGNLAPSFIELVLGRYEGTRLGAQELHAQYLDDVEGALWTMRVLEATRVMAWNVELPWPSLDVAVTAESRTALGLGTWELAQGERRQWVTWVGVDPPGETAECGIIVATAPKRARAGHDHAVVLDDMSVAGPPEVWGARVVEAMRKWNAEGAAVEKNMGGDMVRAVIHNVDTSVQVEKVNAAASKYDRAEPISTLYARGWVHHYGHLAELENQQTTWVPTESKSPDRMDALVHVLTKLLNPQPVRRATVHSPVPRS